MRRHEPTRSFNAVGAGQTATLNLPPDGIYHKLMLHYAESGTAANSATVIAALDELRLIVNGKVQRRMTGEDLLAINAYHGKGYTAGQLPIFFSEPWRRTVQGEDALAWGMGDVETFQLEVDIASGRTGPTLAATSVKDIAVANMGPIVKWRKYTVPVSAVGTVNIDDFDRRDTQYAFHCKSTDIDHVRVELDREIIIDTDVATLEDTGDDQGFSWQSGWTHIDFNDTRRVGDGLPMIDAAGQRKRDFLVNFDMSAATTFSVVSETLGLRD